MLFSNVVIDAIDSALKIAEVSFYGVRCDTQITLTAHTLVATLADERAASTACTRRDAQRAPRPIDER